MLTKMIKSGTCEVQWSNAILQSFRLTVTSLYSFLVV